MRVASEKVYNFIKDYEKFRAKLYNDAASNATIGYGHLVHHGKVGTNPVKEKEFEKGITEPYALQLLKADVKSRAEDYVNRYVRVTLTQNQFDALVIFTFNVGAGNFANSTLLKKVNSNGIDAATIASCFKQWNKVRKDGSLVISTGLMIRRKQESDIYNSNIYVSIH